LFASPTRLCPPCRTFFHYFYPGRRRGTAAGGVGLYSYVKSSPDYGFSTPADGNGTRSDGKSLCVDGKSLRADGKSLRADGDGMCADGKGTWDNCAGRLATGLVRRDDSIKKSGERVKTLASEDVTT
jgi:hypothetical protein